MDKNKIDTQTVYEMFEELSKTLNKQSSTASEANTNTSGYDSHKKHDRTVGKHNRRSKETKHDRTSAPVHN
jgi:hypothetical protein